MQPDDPHMWPAAGSERLPWDAPHDPAASHRARLRARCPYTASIPPFIAGLRVPPLDAATEVAAEDALTELARFDAEYGRRTAPFASILLRSESASSSEIEQLTAHPKSIALAELGGKAGSNARLVVANVRAMEAAIELSPGLDTAAIIVMQKALLEDTHPEYTGTWRNQQVWVGGGMANSPHSASFVPPHHERVPALMEDLVSFCQRTDVPLMAHIAVAHAQFETIHPFPDGNGRTGRALVHSLLHRFGVTRNLTIPVSAGLLQDTAGYFDALTAYRTGNPQPIVGAFTKALTAALSNGRQLVSDLEEFHRWAMETTSARRGSAGWRSIELLIEYPVIDARTIASELGVTAQNAQNGIGRLVDDGILAPTSASRRNRTYEATAVLDALGKFAERARRRRPV
ncbi:Fic family protein [Arthrobacter sp.]|uniref:Fic family protein n=1 Tax=Arthrobacter sp. TaxID=1667 RepID=UPI003A91AFD7